MLKPGLYEQVINYQLGQELDAATDKLSHTAPIDGAEASRVLAKNVTRDGKVRNQRMLAGDLPLWYNGI